MKIFVTGANGFIGSNLCKKLLEKGFDVSRLIRTSDSNIKNSLENKTFHLLKTDLNDFPSLDKFFKFQKIDLIIHLAAYISGLNDEVTREKLINSNIEGTRNLLEAARKNNIKKIIYSSTMEVYGKPRYVPVDENHPKDPINFYGMTKLTAENLCKKYSDNGISIIVLRFSGVFGPPKNKGVISNFINAAIAGGDLIINGGSQTTDFVSVDDVIDSIILSVLKVNETHFDDFNIGSGQEKSLLEIAFFIKSEINPNIKIVVSNKNVARNFRFYYSIEKAKKELHYNPKPLEERIKEFIEWKKGNIHAK